MIAAASILADAYVAAGGRPSIALDVACGVLGRLIDRGLTADVIADGEKILVRPMTATERAETVSLNELLEG